MKHIEPQPILTNSVAVTDDAALLCHALLHRDVLVNACLKSLIRRVILIAISSVALCIMGSSVTHTLRSTHVKFTEASDGACVSTEGLCPKPREDYVRVVIIPTTYPNASVNFHAVANTARFFQDTARSTTSADCVHRVLNARRARDNFLRLHVQKTTVLACQTFPRITINS